MTVTTTEAKDQYTLTGAGTDFAFSFKIFAETDLVVIREDTSGVETTLTLTTDYTVSASPWESGGTVTTVTNYADGTLTIKRQLPRTQTKGYTDASEFPAPTHEEALDREVILIQELEEKIGRAPLLKESTTSTTPTFPEPSASKVIAWNSGGTDLENISALDTTLSTVSAFMDTVLDDSTAAEARATLGFTDTAWITDYTGGDPDQGSGVDITTALNLAIADLDGDKYKIYFPPGVYYFNSKPDNISTTVHILGAGRAKTFFYKNWASADTDKDGIFNLRDGATNCYFRDFTSYATSAGESGGAGTGCHISAVSTTATGSVDGLICENIWLSSQATSPTSYNKWNIYVDGTARTTAAIGVRDISFINCTLFGAESGAIMLKGVINCAMTGGGTFPAGGDSGEVHISGDATVNSYYVSVDMPVFGGANLDRCQEVMLRGHNTGTITNTSNAIGCLYVGHNNGTIQTNWAKSRYINSHGFEAVETGKSIAATTAYTSTHTLGVKPAYITARLRCTTTDLGYAVGEEVELTSCHEITFFTDSSNIKYTTGPSITLINRGTGASGTITFTSWVLEIDAYQL